MQQNADIFLRLSQAVLKASTDVLRRTHPQERRAMVRELARAFAISLTNQTKIDPIQIQQAAAALDRTLHRFLDKEPFPADEYDALH